MHSPTNPSVALHVRATIAWFARARCASKVNRRGLLAVLAIIVVASGSKAFANSTASQHLLTQHFVDQSTQKRSLQHALTTAATASNSQHLHAQDLVWLADMSDRLTSRIPNPHYRVRLLKTILNEARANGLDPQLVLAVIDVESSFKRDAVSKSGAVGLMQIMPFWLTVYQQPDADLSNPLVSVRFGCNILRHYVDRYDNIRNALAAYNGSLGFATYPDLVFASYKSRWRHGFGIYPSTNIDNSLTLAANTGQASIKYATVSDTLAQLVLPESQTALTLRPPPTVIETRLEKDVTVENDSQEANASVEATVLSSNDVVSTMFYHAEYSQ